jgi:hypothetical protein
MTLHPAKQSLEQLLGELGELMDEPQSQFMIGLDPA